MENVQGFWFFCLWKMFNFLHSVGISWQLQGGILWFNNLTEFPHGALGPVFPILVAGLHYLNVQVLYCFVSSFFVCKISLAISSFFSFLVSYLLLPGQHTVVKGKCQIWVMLHKIDIIGLVINNTFMISVLWNMNSIILENWSQNFKLGSRNVSNNLKRRDHVLSYIVWSLISMSGHIW